MSDKLPDGRSFRVLTLVDYVARVRPGLEADFRMSVERVCQVLDRATGVNGQPKSIGHDNGPKFISNTMCAWAYWMGIKICFSGPGKPTDNALCESFNGKLRNEFLRTV
jgi:putative transposase